MTPVTPEVGAALNRRLAAAIGADPSGSDLSQVLRVPGTRSYKHATRPLVRVAALTAVQYDPNDLDQFLPPLRRSPAQRPVTQRATALLHAPAERGSETPPVPLSSAALRIWRGERPTRKGDGTVDRSASLYAIGRIMARAVSREDLIAALAERDAALYGKYRDRPQEYARLADALQCETDRYV